jgi:leucyl aminopeptidase
MTLTFDVVGTAPDRVKVDLLAVPVFTGGLLGPGADVVDTALGGTLAAFMTEAGFEAKRGEALAVPTSGRLGAKTAVLVGMGERDTLDADALRRAGAAVARRASKVVKVATTVLDAAPESIDRGDAAQAFVEGVALGSYQFLNYKSEAKPSKLARVQVLGRANAKVRDGIARGTRIAAAVAWARDLVNEPAADKSPDAIAKLTRALARANGLTIKVLAGEQLERERLGGVLGVGKGSQRPPRFVRLAYEPKGARATLAFVGKGVVFDSGGLSLKTAGGMETMKTDMSGGAAVIAAMSTLRDLNVKIRVIGFIPLVENMPSGDAMRPGDVLRMRNGKTVEVLNTDAEGRLILADALSLASEEEPDAIVDLATLTGACVVALGEKVAGLMGDEAWVEQIRGAADRAGEAVWHLPLPPEYRKMIDSEIADIKNISGAGGGGALTAGLFLREFSGDVPWAHLDIAGPARAGSDDGYIVRGGTGFGVRTLVELARTFKAPKST